jgi:phosphatidylglycerophosphatase A
MQEVPSVEPSVALPVIRPSMKFVCSHPAHMIALAAGAGLSPRAPGTVGTLWAWAAFGVMQLYLSSAQIGAVIAVSLLAGWWACSVTATHLRMPDPSVIVWDEVVAFWIVLWLVMPASWVSQCAVFALFRFFDAVKPGPVAWADRLFHGHGWRGGFGIVFDDLVAAGCTLLAVALWRF